MCTRPKAAQSYVSGKDLKPQVRLSGPNFQPNLLLPCKKCQDCKLKKAREWALRCWHETQMHESSCFVTFTYDDAHLPPYGELRHKDFQDFMKRFREKNQGEYKYFMCGEYGDKTHRPHYHAIIFGYFPPDPVWLRKDKGNNYYKSKSLDDCWQNGFTDVTSVSYANSGYLARYSLKKQLPKEDTQDRYVYISEHGELKTRPFEYIRMSTGRKFGQGLGASWLRKYYEHVLENDYVLNPKKQKLPVPKYYLEILARDFCLDTTQRNALLRIEKAQAADISTPERLRAKEICIEANNRNHTRPYL